MRAPRVVMLSDDETSGGAAVAATRLAEGLVRAGADVVRIVARPDGQPHRWATHVLPTGRRPSTSAEGRLGRLARRLAPRLVSRLEKDRWRRHISGQLRALLHEIHPDIVNVHNVHAAGWEPALIAECCRYAPTVWTLHDMWSFSGRCAYAYSCRKFVMKCDETCPTPAEYPALAPDRIAGAWRARRRLLDDHPGLGAVCPSQWLAREATAGLWAGHRVQVIPYGLPLETYRPLSRTWARQRLDIPSTGPVMLMVAQQLAIRRKGGLTLASAVAHLRTRPLTLLLSGNDPMAIREPGITVRAFGHVDDEERKVLAYNAADLLVHPAPVDNFPNVVLEALATGTPVVAFPIGGLPDMVRPGLTGWLASEMSDTSLARTIDLAFEDLGQGGDLRASCRKVAEDEYSERTQADRYLELFSALRQE